MTFSSESDTKKNVFYLLCKRFFDFGAALLGLFFLAPLILLVSLLVWIFLGRPILFRQIRPGQNGRPFGLFKFRTMKPGCEPDHVRLGTFGRLVRKLSLDELPQLLNVLLGHMSLVGPRPLLMQYLTRYNSRQRIRHLVKPGITGWAQVKGRNALTWEQKFELDIWYVQNASFWLDIKILFLTFKTVLMRDGVNQSGHVTMPEFMGSKDS